MSPVAVATCSASPRRDQSDEAAQRERARGSTCVADVNIGATIRPGGDHAGDLRAAARRTARRHRPRPGRDGPGHWKTNWPACAAAASFPTLQNAAHLRDHPEPTLVDLPVRVLLTSMGRSPIRRHRARPRAADQRHVTARDQGEAAAASAPAAVRCSSRRRRLRSRLEVLRLRREGRLSLLAQRGDAFLHLGAGEAEHLQRERGVEASAPPCAASC